MITRAEREKALWEIDQQIERLEKAGIEKEIGHIDWFRFKRKIRCSASTAIANVKLYPGRLPAVIVIPPKLTATEWYEVRIEFNSRRRAESNINFDCIRNAPGVETPCVFPYLLIDVEPGTEMLGKSPERAAEEIIRLGRSGLTAHEGFTLLFHHPELLKKHYIDLVGSVFEQERFAYYCTVSLQDNRPVLGRTHPDKENKRWGAASCASRKNCFR